MRQYRTIAFNAFMELLRQPVFLLLMTSSSVFAVFLASTPYFGFGDDPKLVKDSVLATLLLVGLFGAVISASSSVANEIRTGTALAVLSKPVGRVVFLLGKYTGLASTLLVLTYVNLVSALVASKISFTAYGEANKTAFFIFTGSIALAYLVALHQTLTIFSHALEYFLGIALGQSQLLDTRKGNLNSISILGFSADGCGNLGFDIVEFQFFFTRRNQIAERVLPDHTVLGITNEAFQVLLRFHYITIETLEENGRITDSPTNIYFNDEWLCITSRGLFKFALEILETVIEPVDLLNRPGQFVTQARIRNCSRIFSKGGYHGNL
ncbi:hypothetical protein OAM21_04315 [Verrucomicrobia bacterium]|nr:hypothetical protein [Verrucomicrobiota bacterium]